MPLLLLHPNPKELYFSYSSHVLQKLLTTFFVWLVLCCCCLFFFPKANTKVPSFTLVWRNCASPHLSVAGVSRKGFLWHSPWTIVLYFPEASCLLSSCFTSSIFTHQNQGPLFFLFSKTSMIDIIFFRRWWHLQKVPWNNTVGIYIQIKPSIWAQKGHCQKHVPTSSESLLLLNKGNWCARWQREGRLAVLLILLKFSFVRVFFNLPGDISLVQFSLPILRSHEAQVVDPPTPIFFLKGTFYEDMEW